MSKFVYAYLGARGTLPLLRCVEWKATKGGQRQRLCNGPKAMRTDERLCDGRTTVPRLTVARQQRRAKSLCGTQ